MKRFLHIALLFCAFAAQAQDYDFLAKLPDIATPDDARIVADSLVQKLKGDFVFYKQKEFEQGFLRIVYVPVGMTEAEIKEQRDYDGSFVADFVVVKRADDTKAYTFDKAKAKYETVFPAWQAFFKPDAKPDKKSQRLVNQEKGIIYSFNNRDGVWVISR
jgi:hypothetical protein